MTDTSVSRLLGPTTRTPRTMARLVLDAARDAPDDVLFSRRVTDAWVDVAARDFLAEASDLAKGLIAWGLEPGGRIALMSTTRYEWTLVDFAVWLAGGVPVPIYDSSSAEQVAWILQDSGAVAMVLETVAHGRVLREVGDGPGSLRASWTIDDGDLDTLVLAGADVSDETLAARSSEVEPDHLATIIYTSGTTGRPKGCALTHAVLDAEVTNTSSVLTEVFCGQKGAILLFLPLAHVFARLIQLGCVASRTRMGHTSDVAHLVEDLAVFRPTSVLGVPRVFEKIYNNSEQRARAAGKAKVFGAAADTAVQWSEAQDHGGPSIGLRARHAVFDRLVYAKLRNALGGRLSYALSGGAPLGPRLGHFFRGAGINVLEGYGLTETCAASTVNRAGHVKMGTVGPAVPGCDLRIAEDGEILIRGPQVFGGYYAGAAEQGGLRVPVYSASSAEVFVDGWFRSGDIGSLDADGYLTITGRKKEIIVTAAGKNVAPAVLEDRLRAHPLVSQCVVVGDGQPYIAAVVTLDADALPGWLSSHARPALAPTDAVTDDFVLAAIQAAVDDANKAVSRAESIRRFSLLPVDFTEDRGHLTPSMKLRRAAVMKDFASEIDALYS